MALHFKIITPLRTALQADVTSIHLLGTEGEMEILPGHTDIIASVGNGELTCRTAEGKSISLFIGGGFLQVEGEQAMLVTDTALEDADIDTTSIEAAIEKAQEALRNRASVLSREEQTYLEAVIAKQLAILDYNKVRRRR
ncbi:MAG: ATP synthase F1 subunit epsilon [Akkermansia sp.]|nr:ATP synthase F1 subunit epsilon [Akkermansia sp.]